MAKVKCLQNTSEGDKIIIELEFPTQQEIDEGGLPSVFLDLTDYDWDLADENGCVHLFNADIYELLCANVEKFTTPRDRAECADTLACWLEYWTEKLREKYPIPPRHDGTKEDNG